MVIIVKCPDSREDFSEDHIIDITEKSPLDMWMDFTSHPHKTRTLLPWVGPKGQWTFFYELTGDGRYLVIDIDRIYDVINKLEMRINTSKEIKYLLDLLTWKRDQQISKIIETNKSRD